VALLRDPAGQLPSLLSEIPDADERGIEVLFDLLFLLKARIAAAREPADFLRSAPAEILGDLSLVRNEERDDLVADRMGARRASRGRQQRARLPLNLKTAIDPHAKAGLTVCPVVCPALFG
jgi:hypothetical protein